MNKIEQTFGRKRVLLPVIHVRGFQQAEEQVLCALENEADGAFLINHSIPVDELIVIYASIVTKHSPLFNDQAKYSKFWLGMNMLGLKPKEALERMPDNECGLWTDDAGVDPKRRHYSPADEFVIHRPRSGWKGLYFGGVAFKYQAQPENLGYVTWMAMAYMDVVTTSGDATGLAPDIEKIRLMHESKYELPMAIASGITADNVEQFLPYCDAFLVATGISKSFDELDPRKVRELAGIIHQYK